MRQDCYWSQQQIMSKNRIRQRLQLMQKPQAREKVQVGAVQRGIEIETNSIRLPQHRGGAHTRAEVHIQPVNSQKPTERRQRTLGADDVYEQMECDMVYCQSKSVSLSSSKYTSLLHQDQSAPQQFLSNYSYMHGNRSVRRLNTKAFASLSVSSYRQEETQPQCQPVTNNSKLTATAGGQSPVGGYQLNTQAGATSSRITQSVTLSREQSVCENVANTQQTVVSIDTSYDGLQLIQLPSSPNHQRGVFPTKQALQSAVRSPVRLQSQHRLQQSPSPLKNRLKGNTDTQIGQKVEESIIRCVSFCQETEQNIMKTPVILKHKNPSFFIEQEQDQRASSFLKSVSRQLKTLDSRRKQTELRISRRLGELSERASSMVRKYSQQSKQPSRSKKILVVSKNLSINTCKSTKQGGQSKESQPALSKMDGSRGEQKENDVQQLRGMILNRFFS